MTLKEAKSELEQKYAIASFHQKEAELTWRRDSTNENAELRGYFDGKVDMIIDAIRIIGNIEQ